MRGLDLSAFRSWRGGLLLVALVFFCGCPDKKAKYPVCEKDSDCNENEKCINKRCVQCTEDSECPDGQSCQQGACTEPEGYCTTTADCSGGLVCKNNSCTTCASDAECGDDRRCSNGVCLARGVCNVDEDCADDEDCINGKCARPGRSGPPEVSCKLEPVFFGFDQFSVNSTNSAVLERNRECIRSANNRAVILYGHTDPRGTEEYNIALSEKRANAAADYLARLGVDPIRLMVVPKGEGEATGFSEAGWSKDRRVEFEWK